MPDGSTQIRKDLSYYSHGRFTYTQSGTSPNFTETLAAGTELRLFGYAKGDDMVAAGRSGTQAMECDTNLQNKGETLDGETVLITAIKLQATGQSDPLAVKNLFRDLSVKVSLNGGDRAMLLGNGEMIPGGNGFVFSTGISPSSGAAVPGVSNGWPDDANAKMIKSGILWLPKGKTDSSLVVLVNVNRANSYTVAFASAVAAVVDLRCELVCFSVANRSPNL